MDHHPIDMSPNPTVYIPEHAIAVVSWAPGGSDAMADRSRHRKTALGTIVAIVKRGTYIVARNGAPAATLREGEAFLAQDGDRLDITHRGTLPGKPMAAQWSHFRITLFGCIDACALFDLPLVLDAKRSARIAKLIEMTHSAGPGLDGALRRVEAGLATFRELSEAAPLSAAGRTLLEGNPGLRALGPWVLARLAQPIAIVDLVRITGYSRSRLHARFQQEFGCAPLKWVREQRLLAARDRLIATAEGVADIGAACGFADPFHFSRAMRARFGLAPTALRREGGLAP